MDFIERNLFTKLRSENFNTGEKIEPMTKYKQGKLQQYIERQAQSAVCGNTVG